MVIIYELIPAENVPRENFFKVMRRARQIALTIEGVYDLALYQAEQTGAWRCTVEMDGQQPWELLQTDQRFQEVWTELTAQGVQVMRRDPMERRI